jgi:hypothetical protein
VIHQIAKTLEYFNQDKERLVAAINGSEFQSFNEQPIQ